jgi:hypothetical protein
VRAAAARVAHRAVRSVRGRDRRAVGVAGRTFVEDHRHVTAETLLRANHVLGRQRVGAAIDVGNGT